MLKEGNVDIVKQVYGDHADVALNQIEYISSDDIRFINDEKLNVTSKKFYRRKIFKITGTYFNEQIAKRIYMQIVHFYKARLQKDENLKFGIFITSWKLKYLDKWIDVSKLHDKKLKEAAANNRKSFFKKLFH